MIRTQGRNTNPVTGAQSRSLWVPSDSGLRVAGPDQGRAHPRTGSEEQSGGKDKKETEQGYLRRVLDDT